MKHPKKQLKRIISLFLILSLLLCGVCAADAGDAQEAAEYLAGLGVFRGSDAGYELDRAPTRIEALIMLLRLLGEEEAALNCTEACIFTDVPGWAARYVAYAYEQGYTTGAIHDSIRQRYLFDVGDANANMFLTFVLRALGYGAEDFRYEEAVEMADGLGLLPAGTDTKRFLRGDLALVSRAALSVRVKGQAYTLAEKLGLADKTPAQNTASLTLTAATEDELYARLNEALETYMPMRLELQVSGALAELSTDELLDLVLDCSCSWFHTVTAYYIPGQDSMTLEPTYARSALAWAYWTGLRSDHDSDTYRDVQPLMAKAEALLLSLQGDAPLSDAALVRAIHDAIAGSAAYDADYDGVLNQEADGVLLHGSGVCDSYSYAFWLLCRMAEIPCIRVTGDALGPHSWNKVAIEGTWYNVDVTWDDAAYFLNGVLTERVFHDYYLVSDETLAADHSWKQYDSMPQALWDSQAD